ncbi:unnamed protein product [Nezara viridula]|uniref:Uncharacterized protein n=1 Tax=Nezara viridula TaxID=85310 RepID=A0A9P0H682_NEZVI|nr:unnamed protein product [Nezara viridula]
MLTTAYKKWKIERAHKQSMFTCSKHYLENILPKGTLPDTGVRSRLVINVVAGRHCLERRSPREREREVEKDSRRKEGSCGGRKRNERRWTEERIKEIEKKMRKMWGKEKLRDDI